MIYSGKDRFLEAVLAELPDRINIFQCDEYVEYYNTAFAVNGDYFYTVAVYKDFLTNAVEPLVILRDRILEEEEKFLNA